MKIITARKANQALLQQYSWSNRTELIDKKKPSLCSQDGNLRCAVVTLDHDLHSLIAVPIRRVCIVAHSILRQCTVQA